jgi:hypothetical protein
MKVKGHDALDAQCPRRWCWAPGNYQHRGACGGGGSRNTGAVSSCCLERAYRGCPQPLPEPGVPNPHTQPAGPEQ